MRRLFLVIGILGLISIGCARSQEMPKTEVERAQAAVEKAPGFSSYTSLGVALGRAGKDLDAVAAFEHSVEVSPRSPVAHNNVCAKYNDLGRWEDAIESCRRALEIEPEFVLAKNNLAFAERSKAAEEAGLKLAEGKLGSGEAGDQKRLSLGMKYYQDGRYEKAITLWKSVSKRSSVFAAAQNDIASALIVLKKFDQAKQHLEVAIRLKPKEPLFQNNRRWLETAERDAENLGATPLERR